MSDWREMDAGPEMDELVARNLGWRAVDLNDNVHGSRVRGPNWTLISPNGERTGWGWNELQAWEHTELPAYSTNLSAAITLVEDDGDFVLDRSAIDEWHVCVHQVYFAIAPTPALAICRAWIAWKVGQENIT
jgi:hypothetical protein